MSHVKTITIRCEDLGKDVRLVLTFDKDYEDIFTTAWRVFPIPKAGPHHFTAKYEQRLVFTKPQVVKHIVQPTATHSKEIINGQKTILNSTVIGGHRSFWFSEPTTTEGELGKIIAYNNSDSFADIGVGLVDPGIKDPATILLWKEVGHGQSVPVKFTPILYAHIVGESLVDTGLSKEDDSRDPSSPLALNDISENETSGVESTQTLDAHTSERVRMNKRMYGITSDLNWSQDLNELRDETDWRLIRNKESGKFSLIGDDTRF